LVEIEVVMVVARFIGRIPVIIGSILFGILGIILIGVGAAATPTGTGSIIIGVALIVGAVLLILDAMSTPASSSSSS
jgi:hypothetical protein